MQKPNAALHLDVDLEAGVVPGKERLLKDGLERQIEAGKCQW